MSRPDAGFTLLEVLIAFVIAALAVGVLLQGSAAGLRAADVAGRTEEAVSRAQSHLAVIGHGTPVVAGEASGDDGGGYRWRTRIERIADAPIGPQANGDDPVTPASARPRQRLALYAVAVAITWTDGTRTRQVELDSRRVAAEAPGG